MAQGELTRTGRVLLTLGYAFHYNESNSFGETLIRHFAFARFATALPCAFYLAARADLLFAFYRDPIPVAQTTDTSQMAGGKQFATIEDENRSSLRVDLSRDITAPLRASFATPSTPTSWAATAPPTAATPCCCRGVHLEK